MRQSLNLYISFSQKDEYFKEELVEYLMPLKKHKNINDFYSRAVPTKARLTEPIYRQLRDSDIVLLLLSKNYFVSTDNWRDELDIAVEMSQNNVATVIPIILSECDWQNTKVGNLLALPKNGKPISAFNNRDEAYKEILYEIQLLLSILIKEQKWKKIINDELQKRSGKLQLDNCNLNNIPTEVGDMTWLTELSLEDNSIREIKGLEKLSKLTALKLSGNDIQKIENLNNLLLLDELTLDDNAITKIEGIENLTSLTWLSLDKNKINRIEGLDSLVELTHIYLKANQIKKIEGFNKLLQLSHIDLDSNNIERINGFKGLTQLRFINLTNNNIAKIEGLDGLHSLSYLSLSKNKVIAIEGLHDLNNLEKLYLNNNQIKKIERTESLSKLSVLSLSSNEISELDNLNKLQKLEHLFLNYNQIDTFENLEKIPKSVKTLFLFGNPVKNISPTLLGNSAKQNCLNDLKSFFAENIGIIVPEVKLILVGNSDVGKTAFKKYLTAGVFDRKRNSTHGLEILNLVLNKDIINQYNFQKETKITIWDFGGQEYFHNTHQLFFNQSAVYVYMWEKNTNKNEPLRTEIKTDQNGKIVVRVLEHFDTDYWLSNIRYFAKDAPILIVQNKTDQYELDNEPIEFLPHSSIKKYGCNNQYNISLSKTADKDLNYWFDFEKLKYAVFTELKTFVSKNKEGKIYNSVRKEIENREESNYWRIEDYIEFIEALKNNSSSATATSIDNRLVIDHFNKQGKILYPVNYSLEKGKVIFTNPQWLSEKIYEILNEEVLQRNGFFNSTYLDKLIADKLFEKKEILDELIKLMIEYKIIFFDPRKSQYVAPQYLPEVPTNDYSQVKKLLGSPKLIVKVEGFLPKAIINNIIAKYAVKDEITSYFKYGVKAELENHDIILVEVEYSQKKIFIYTDALNVIHVRDIFSDILVEFGLTLEKDVHPTALSEIINPSNSEQNIITASENQNLYISIDDSIYVNWITLWNSYRDSKSRDLDYCISEDKNMVLKKVYAPYYLPYKDVINLKFDDQIKPSRLFISYSSKNLDFMKRFVTHLEPLKRNGTIEFWYDRMIMPGTKWDESIKNELKDSDIVIFLLSPDFIATDYIFDYEIPQAIKQFESENSKLFFVELQACSWNRTILSRFQQTVDPNSSNKDVIEISEAKNDTKWKMVIDELEKRIIKRK